MAHLPIRLGAALCAISVTACVPATAPGDGVKYDSQTWLVTEVDGLRLTAPAVARFLISSDAAGQSQRLFSFEGQCLSFSGSFAAAVDKGSIAFNGLRKEREICRDDSETNAFGAFRAVNADQLTAPDLRVLSGNGHAIKLRLPDTFVPPLAVAM